MVHQLRTEFMRYLLGNITLFNAVRWFIAKNPFGNK